MNADLRLSRRSGTHPEIGIPRTIRHLLRLSSDTPIALLEGKLSDCLSMMHLTVAQSVQFATAPPLTFKAIVTLPQPTAFMALVKGYDGKCPCCRRPFADA